MVTFSSDFSNMIEETIRVWNESKYRRLLRLLVNRTLKPNLPPAFLDSEALITPFCFFFVRLQKPPHIYIVTVYKTKTRGGPETLFKENANMN